MNVTFLLDPEWTAKDAVHEFIGDLGNEIERRISRVSDEQAGARSVRESTRLAGERMQLTALLGFVRGIKVEVRS